MKELTASIVAYKNPANVIAHAIQSFLRSTSESHLYLIDNSPSDRLKCLANDPRIKYVFTNKNVGFGAGHNIAIREILNSSKYHLVLNPDVYFQPDVIRKLYDFMEEHRSIGQVMPKVFYPDGRLQLQCKLLPSPKTLILRRFLNFLHFSLKRENYHYEFQFSGYDKVMDVPFLSGCFMFLRTEALKKVGLFDERFFLYTEDTDLTRRIHRHFRTVYYPDATIYHHYARGAYNDFWLLWKSVQSTVKYFNKWGWFNDQEREYINRRILLNFNSE